MNTKIFLLCTVAVFLTLSARKLDRRLIVHRFVQHYVNPDYLIFVVNLTKPDRQMFCSNFNITVLQDIPLSSDIKMRIALYKYSDNMYKKTALGYEGGLCDYFSKVEKTLFNMKNDIFEHFIRGCPIKKGTYYAYNISEKLVKYPLPLWTCKATYIVDNDVTTLLNMTTYFSVVEV